MARDAGAAGEGAPHRQAILLPAGIPVLLGAAGLAYTGVAALALIPVVATVVQFAAMPDREAELRSRLLFLGALAIWIAGTLVAVQVHPSPAGPVLMYTATGSAAAGLIISFGGRRSVPTMLGIGTAVAVMLLLAAIGVDRSVVAGKSALAAFVGVLPGLALSPSIGVGNPNGAGVIASVVACGWLATALTARGRRGQAVAGSLAGLSTLVVLASGSRAGYLSLGLGALVAIWNRLPRIARWSVAVALAGVLVALVVLSLAPAGQPFRAGLDEFEHTRLAIWAQSLPGIGVSPLIGNGPGSFAVLYPDSQTSPVNSHNTLIQVWFELGLAPFVVVTALTAWCLWATLRGLGRAAAGSEVVVLAAMSTAWAVHSMFESTILAAWHLPGAQPWEGYREVAIPLAFLIAGLVWGWRGRRTAGR